MDAGWIVLIACVGLIAAFVAGVWVGGNFVRSSILGEIVENGFINFRDVRYRVDRIGRKPRGDTTRE